MLKCCISTRDTEIQIQPILSELFPESGTIPTKNATPTWARSPGSVGNLRSMGIDWFHQESLYGSGSKRNFFMLPTVLGVRSCYSPPGQQGCLAVAARQQRWAHVGCQRFYKGQKGGWGREGWGGMESVALHSHSEYSSVCSSFCLEPARSRFFPQVLVLFMITEVMCTVTENGLLNPAAVGLLSCSVSVG